MQLKTSTNLPVYDLAYESINSNEASKSLVDINFKYNFLKDGIPVNYKDAGEIVETRR